MRRGSGVALGLVVLLSGCGDAAKPPTASRPARTVCGYDATAALPDNAAEVLPGQPALLSPASDAQVDALVDLPFNGAFDAIVERARKRGWTLGDRERESDDAELELVKNGQRLSLSLSPSGISGCTATRVALVAADE